MPRGDDFSLIPPLELPQAHLGNAGNIAAAESPLRCDRGFRTRFFCFEHEAPLAFFIVADLDSHRNCTEPVAGVKEKAFVRRTAYSVQRLNGCALLGKRLSSSHELYDFQVGTVGNHGFLPVGFSNDGAVQFHRDAIGLQAQIG
jgi:hypothetical protein